MTVTVPEVIYESQKTHTAFQIEVDRRVRERVLNGIKWLEEEYGPEWKDKIDLDLLQLTSSSYCVLGQLYSEMTGEEDGYTWAVRTFDLQEKSSKLGFSADSMLVREMANEAPAGEFDGYWKQLDAAWQQEIVHLRG